MARKLNVEMLERVKKQITKHNGLMFQMGNFFAGLFQLDTDTDAKRDSIPACGTAACIAGWTITLHHDVNPKMAATICSQAANSGPKYEYERGNEYEWGKAKQILGLTETQADDLFSVDNWPIQFLEAYDNAIDSPAKQARIAAKRIDYLIKTGK